MDELRNSILLKNDPMKTLKKAMNNLDQKVTILTPKKRRKMMVMRTITPKLLERANHPQQILTKGTLLQGHRQFQELIVCRL